jgi:hypothetical protein
LSVATRFYSVVKCGPSRERGKVMEVATGAVVA